MSNQEIIVGLDIGTTKICAIVGCKNEYGKLEVLGMGKAVSDGVNRGIVTNIDKTVRAIQKAVTEAEAQSGIEINVVNVGIAGQHIKSSIYHGSITRNSNEDEISIEDVNRLTEDMYRIVTPPGSQIIHVMPQDYIVDYEDGIMDPVGMTGVRLEADFHIITAQTNAINNINKCVKRAGLKIQNLILEPLASSLAVLSDQEKEAGVCLVDIGGGTTDIAIFHDNIIRHTAVIPFGGNIVTSDIKQGCMVLENQAELLKVKFGKAIAEEASLNEVVSIPGMHNRPPKEISIKNLAHIIEARMQVTIHGLALFSFNAIATDNTNVKDRQYLDRLERQLRRTILRSDKSKLISRKKASRALKHFPIKPVVKFSFSHPKLTTMEVLAQDQPGLLHNVALILQRHQIQLVNARIATFGERAEDIFFIKRINKEPIQGDESIQEVLQSEICAALEH